MAKKFSPPNIFLYNGAKAPKIRNKKSITSLKHNDNVNIKLPQFVFDIGHIGDRYLDLIELSAYVYCADRFTSRGGKDSLYLKSWCRNFKHVMKVKDFDFWNQEKVRSKLSSLLSFMSGDEHHFIFEPGLLREKASLFDSKECWLEDVNDYNIIMFSGGLDSTTGILDQLKTNDRKLILTSHIPRPSTKSVITKLKDELNKDYPGRVESLLFECNLKGARAAEETQRTRSFLYSSIGGAIANARGQNQLYYYENGIVSINLPPNEQFINASIITHK